MHNSDFWNSFKCYPCMECCQAITILFLVWKSRVSCTKTLQLSLTYIKVGSTKYITFIMVWIKDFIYWFFGSIQRVLAFCLWAISLFQELMNPLYCLLFLEPQYSILFYSESILQQHVQLHLCLSLFKSKTSVFCLFFWIHNSFLSMI